MEKAKLTTILGVGTVLAIVSCGGSDPLIPADAFPVVANAELAVGRERLLVALLNTDGVSHAAPDLPIEVDLYPPGQALPTIESEGTFMWTVPDERGLYRADVTFDRAGTWAVALHITEGPPTRIIPFEVAPEGRTPALGDPAPAVVTPTAADVSNLSEITTDPEPDPRFYEMSLDAALSSGRPTVAVFATPALCESATCGPMLDTVKQVSSAYPEINFIHVEIYQNLKAVTHDQLQVVDAVEVWGLPSEPWVFVMDSDGRVTAKFEGVVDLDEVRSALESLS